jgi:hypothetical protein
LFCVHTNQRQSPEPFDLNPDRTASAQVGNYLNIQPKALCFTQEPLHGAAIRLRGEDDLVNKFASGDTRQVGDSPDHSVPPGPLIIQKPANLAPTIVLLCDRRGYASSCCAGSDYEYISRFPARRAPVFS